LKLVFKTNVNHKLSVSIFFLFHRLPGYRRD